MVSKNDFRKNQPIEEFSTKIFKKTYNYNDENKIIRTPNPTGKLDSGGIGCMFFNKMKKFQDNVAQIDGMTGEKQTYGALLERCIRAAIAIRARGITPIDNVASYCYRSFDSAVPFIASLFLGIKIAPMDPDLDFEDTILQLQQVKPKILFVSSGTLNMIESVLKKMKATIEVIVMENVEGYQSLNEFLVPNLEEIYFKPVAASNLKDTALLIYTSGSTGKPKGTCISHYAFLGQIYSGINFGFPLDVILLFSSFYWISAVMFFGVATYKGTASVIVRSFEANKVWSIVNRCKPTFINIAPHHLLLFTEKGCPTNLDISSIKYIRVAGGPLRIQQLLHLRKLFPAIDIYPAYGMTEMALFLAGFNPCIAKDRILTAEKPGSCGRGIPGVAYKIVNPDTEEILGVNQPGELRLKSVFALNGYIGVENSDAVWDSDGWVKSGDIMYYDEDHCFYVVNRVKDIFKYKQFHVSPVELENVLVTHPAVSNAVVIGIPDDIDGDLPMGLVTLKDSNSIVNSEDIQQYVDDIVDDRKRLRAGVKIVDFIPSTLNGKIRRREIRDVFLRGEL